MWAPRLIVEGNSRTFVKVPMWLVVLAALSSVKLAVVSALLAIAFGMRVRVGPRVRRRPVPAAGSVKG